MRKTLLLLCVVFTLMSCETDDDMPTTFYAYAVVNEIDLPEYFEAGESYDIDFTYVLPSACHSPAGLELGRGGSTGPERRNIYIFALTSYDASIRECSEEDDDLERDGKFTLVIDEDEPFTFYLWTGTDDEGESEFTTIEVPVGDPDGNPQEDDDE